MSLLHCHFCVFFPLNDAVLIWSNLVRSNLFYKIEWKYKNIRGILWKCDVYIHITLISSVKASTHLFSLRFSGRMLACSFSFTPPPPLHPSICWAGWSGPALIMWALLYLVLGMADHPACLRVHACLCTLEFTHSGVWLTRALACGLLLRTQVKAWPAADGPISCCSSQTSLFPVSFLSFLDWS